MEVFCGTRPGIGGPPPPPNTTAVVLRAGKDLGMLLDNAPGSASEIAGEQLRDLTEQLETGKREEQKYVSLLESQKRLIYLGGKLSHLEYRIVKYLWDRRTASVSDVVKHCWDEPTTPDAERKAIERLTNKLHEISTNLDDEVFLEHKSGFLTLIRPDK